MTKIINPILFAKQLSKDIAKQINVKNDLKCDNQEINQMFQNGRIDVNYNYIIRVFHGPVIYTDTVKRQELFIYANQENIDFIMYFVKNKKHEVQQEYRFVVEIMFHSPYKNKYLLKVSDDLRELMSHV